MVRRCPSGPGSTRPRRVMLVAAVLLLVMARADAREVEAFPAEVLRLGPAPVLTPARFDHEDRLPAAFIAELDPHALWPRSDDRVPWFTGGESTFVTVRPTEGEVPLVASARDSVYYVAFYANVARRGELQISVSAPAALRVYLDGDEVGTADRGGAAADVGVTRVIPRGVHRVLIRALRRGGAGDASLRVGLSSTHGVSLGVDPRHALTDYDELKGMGSYSGLAMSPDGALVAVTRRGGAAGLYVLDATTGAIVAAPGGGSARAVAWSGDGKQLWFRDGADLVTWSRSTREQRVILEDEPGLGAISISQDCALLVFLSTRGAPSISTTKAKRRTELREKLSDWPTGPHLHVLHVASGARQRLAMPGDWSADAFQILGDSRTLVYLRSTPTNTRPWFRTEVRRLDLVTGEDRQIQVLDMGFENRPGLSGFAVSPDGTRCAFTGPPSELGDGVHVEPNAFDPDLFCMDLKSGRWFNVTAELSSAVVGSVRFGANARQLYFVGNAGSIDRLFVATLPEGSGGSGAVRFRQVDVGGEAIHEISLVDDTRFVATTSDTDRIPELVLRSKDREVRLDPNPGLRSRLAFPAPMDVSYKLLDGTPIEAWLYRPAGHDPASGAKLPLVVYYYGGATPTKRGFNELHQFLVAHGYALLVMNPRGAAGYGQAFADSHSADWGTRAGVDILRGVEVTLGLHPDLDPAKVGCFGGSYGGFMTMYLCTQTDRFAAAVSMYGISDLASYYGDGQWGYTYGDQAMARKYPWTDPSWYTEQSPLYHADKIHTPLLLMHGEEDTNVPVGESEQMFTALRLLQRPVELVRFEGEDHGLRGSWENRVRHRTMLLEWFDRYLKSEPEAWAARWQSGG